MTLSKENMRVIAYTMELAVFMLLLRTAINWVEAVWIFWELGLGIMGAGIVLLAVIKDTRYDKLFISIFQFGFSLFLSDLHDFVLVLFGGGIIV